MRQITGCIEHQHVAVLLEGGYLCLGALHQQYIADLQQNIGQLSAATRPDCPALAMERQYDQVIPLDKPCLAERDAADRRTAHHHHLRYLLILCLQRVIFIHPVIARIERGFQNLLKLFEVLRRVVDQQAVTCPEDHIGNRH